MSWCKLVAPLRFRDLIFGVARTIIVIDSSVIITKAAVSDSSFFTRHPGQRRRAQAAFVA